MALLRFQTIISATVRRRHVPIVGALCVLSLGISNLYHPLSTKTTANSFPFTPLFRSTFGGSKASSVHSVRMEATDKTVPTIVVYVTVPNREAGKKLAHSIVKEKLAACVNIVPETAFLLSLGHGCLQFRHPPPITPLMLRHAIVITGKISCLVLHVMLHMRAGVESIYEWKGEIQSDNEELLIIKTRESLLTALTEHVKANHEYEVPEVIAIPIKGGHLPYLEWVKSNTRD